MKTPQPGDIVTPKESTSCYTYGHNYVVTRTDKEVFYVYDDWSTEKQCYIEDWSTEKQCYIEEWTFLKRATLFERICNFVNKILGL